MPHNLFVHIFPLAVFTDTGLHRHCTLGQQCAPETSQTLHHNPSYCLNSAITFVHNELEGALEILGKLCYSKGAKYRSFCPRSKEGRHRTLNAGHIP